MKLLEIFHLQHQATEEEKVEENKGKKKGKLEETHHIFPE